MDLVHLDRVGLTVRISPDKEAVAPISGAPLCIKEADLPASPDRLRLWLEANAWKGGASKPERIAPSRDAIVEAFRSGRFRNKGQAHRMFGEGMKHQAWLALWKEAVAIEPDLAKPGPRSG